MKRCSMSTSLIKKLGSSFETAVKKGDISHIALLAWTALTLPNWSKPLYF